MIRTRQSLQRLWRVSSRPWKAYRYSSAIEWHARVDDSRVASVITPAAHIHTSGTCLLPRNKGGSNRGLIGPEDDPESKQKRINSPSTTCSERDMVNKSDSAQKCIDEQAPSDDNQGHENRSANGGSSSGSEGDNGNDGDGKKGDKPSMMVSRNTVPTVYPQVLALPITRRPLFPGFYKAVVIKNSQVCAAIKEAMERGQPYVGAFLLKDEEEDSDVIANLDRVHRVGVFAQITSIFPTNTSGKADASEDGITAVLYPHRRIVIDELITPVQKGDENEPIPESLSSVDAEKSNKELDTMRNSESSPTESKVDSQVNEKTLDQVNTGEDLPSHTPPYQTAFLHRYGVSLVNVTNLEMEPYDRKPNQYIRAVMSELISVFKDIANLNPLFRDQIANFSISQGAGNVFEEPEKLADFAAAVSSSEVDELQGVLESMNVEDRLQKALLVLKKELVNAQLQSKISKDVENKIQKRQREYYLMEQLKGIKRELGIESDGKDKLIEKFKEKAAKLNMPEAVRKVFDEELAKLQSLEQAASEFNVTRGYLEWITSIPWGVHSRDNYAIKRAAEVLDHDHFGLKDVKDRILEFLAVGKLRGTVEGKIICLVGPPGVGKTSIGKSISKALGREFYRFSVGGLSDVAEIKGHRRTYVGAMPGKAIQALKKVGTENPLILIDEVDKLARGYNGDPSSALLEMLDPEQNASFMDHYLDVPVDLSRVLFVCTANTLSTIPQPLMDRMEVIEVSSYTAEEKRHIARGYLAPQAKEASGLKDAKVILPDESIDFLIKRYARESGVRSLRKLLEKVYRKVAYDIVKEHGEEVFPEPEPSKCTDTDKETAITTEPREPMNIPPTVSLVISEDKLREYLGPPLYHKDRLYTQTMPAGVALGLGYLGNGSGSLMPIETTLMPGKGHLQLTGKLGDVIKESATIALSWAKTHAYELGMTKEQDTSLLDHRDVHLHMPEGAIGKDGPSAGVAFAVSLISLLLNRPLPTTLAMTGEVSLRGMVLPVGGLKEKLLAAHRAGVTTLILPAQNRPSVEADVPKTVLNDLHVHYVTNVWAALEIAFGPGPWSEQARVWNANESPEAASQ
ncbi:ATP-dependent Lon protease [Malassezia sympodialis ATCC 42132]|uniref:Lon protease homolog, mitochondrial n=2 Tax=Malassezia sympodialis (strain ATCC 42132) TaxID=1230383 RepID=A0A1M8A730_MALS4|nr:ATP-dependent Lon protease [Malassezia sympodialis ATCC 42132]